MESKNCVQLLGISLDIQYATSERTKITWILVKNSVARRHTHFHTRLKLFLLLSSSLPSIL